MNKKSNRTNRIKKCKYCHEKTRWLKFNLCEMCLDFVESNELLKGKFIKKNNTVCWECGSEYCNCKF